MSAELRIEPETIEVSVCYALPGRQWIKTIEAPAGTTIEQAVLCSGILFEVPAIDLAICKLGIYGKVRPRETVLRAGDRVEIYRPLLADPKEARRLRARRKR